MLVWEQGLGLQPAMAAAAYKDAPLCDTLKGSPLKAKPWPAGCDQVSLLVLHLTALLGSMRQSLAIPAGSGKTVRPHHGNQKHTQTRILNCYRH